MPPRNDFLAQALTTPDDAEPFLTRVKRLAVAHTPHNANVVVNALGSTVWGEIRWSSNLGWPAANRMADGFSVQFKRGEPDGKAGSGGIVIPTGKEQDAATPLLWDGPHDQENFRVSFLFHGRAGFGHQILIQLRPEIKWEEPIPWWRPLVRQVRYPSNLGGGLFFLPSGSPVFLDEFVVVNA